MVGWRSREEFPHATAAEFTAVVFGRPSHFLPFVVTAFTVSPERGNSWTHWELVVVVSYPVRSPGTADQGQGISQLPRSRRSAMFGIKWLRCSGVRNSDGLRTSDARRGIWVHARPLGVPSVREILVSARRWWPPVQKVGDGYLAGYF